MKDPRDLKDLTDSVRGERKVWLVRIDANVKCVDYGLEPKRIESKAK